MTSESKNLEEIGRALLVLNTALIPFVEGELRRVHGEQWYDVVTTREAHRSSRSGHWDTQTLLAVIWDQWNGVFGGKLGRAERTLVAELRDNRNKWAHQEEFSRDDTYRVIDTAERLLRAISAPETAQLAAQKERLLQARFAEHQQPTAERIAPEVSTPNPSVSTEPTSGQAAVRRSRYDVRKRFGRVQHGVPAEADVLNSQQQAVVDHKGSHLLVLAGAGTGKTKSITHRASELLKTSPPANIVVMTFTNRAAQELYERLCRLARLSDISQLWIGTFHSICRRMLSENATLLGYKTRFGVLDTDDSREMFRRCLPNGASLDVAAAFQMYSLSRNAVVQWESLLERYGLKPRKALVADVLGRYQRRMLRANKMDFDDLLAQTISLLEKHEGVRERYQRRFRHILVDEYQDTSRAQGRILELLACDSNVTVVGDDSQAIYGFRGATVENILRFETDFPGATTLRLERNYRSTPEILGVANESIARNVRRKPKTLFTTSHAGRKPIVGVARDARAEAEFIAEEILKLYRAGVKLANVAVLFRSAYCVRAVEAALASHGIPYSLSGAVPFFSQPHIKAMLAWFALICDPEDEFSIGRVLRQQRGLTGALLEQIEAEADSGERPLWQTAFDLAASTDPQATVALRELQEKVSACRAEYQETKDPVRVLASTVNLHLADHIRRSFPDADARLEDVSVVRDMLAEYSSLERFLEEVTAERLDVSKRGKKAGFEEGDVVSVVSIHAAKGLEWRAVFIIGLVEGWFPDKRCLSDIAVEEERRLFHVAVTRARETLYLTRPALVGDARGDYEVGESRFLNELPTALVERQQVPEKARNVNVAPDGRSARR